MLTKTILFTVTVTALLGAAFAACPSACNGHGSCGNHDKCTCYANWEGHDCSSKGCPVGRNGVVCSGSGMCDGGAGECSCADGYSGEACQRILCPNDCSGRGNCDHATGHCSCVGGFSGNDCSSRLCARGDDPLTYEVENGGDGTVMQTAEVQTVTFSAGMGIDGAATLTYTDLYGQGWTTRPFAVGGENHYVLDYALKTTNNDDSYLVIQYGSNAQSVGKSGISKGTATDNVHAAAIRKALLQLPGIYLPANRADNGKSVRVIQRPGKTSHKFYDGIQADSKLTFDIYITPDPNLGLDTNGGLLSFTSYLAQTDSTTSYTTLIDQGKAFTEIRHANDHSADIKDAFEGLPNNVIPSVTVTKALSTTASTEELGTYGNTYTQSYTIEFSSSANSGDQNMLSCDATPCDHDGCANRKAGVASVSYLHHDPTIANSDKKKAPRINFQGQGYFIISLHRTTNLDGSDAEYFSAGTAYLEWSTGNGVERAEFPVIGTKAEVQTSLRGITGWEGVTVTLHNTATANHAYTVTFPSGYDDGGQTPKVGFVGPATSLGGLAGANDGTGGEIVIYDQRFSNTIWLGDITGWTKFSAAAASGTDTLKLTFQPETGDNFVLCNYDMGYEDESVATALFTASCSTATTAQHDTVGPSTQNWIKSSATLTGNGLGFIRVDYDADIPSQTSQFTEDYFPVGSTVEVLDTTWAEGALYDQMGADTVVTAFDNLYREFKILSHVTNVHGKPFAKLDSAPVTATDKNYALKVTAYNGTTHDYTKVDINAHQGEIQAIQQLNTTGNILEQDSTDNIRIYINAGKTNEEYTEVLTGASSPTEVQEAINAFSALSGPVTVTESGANSGRWLVTFANIDGDVPQLSVSEEHDNNGPYDRGTTYEVTTLKDGWSLTGGFAARLENVQPGSVINVTSAEVVVFTFAFAATSDKYVISYDGRLSSPVVQSAVTDGNVESAFQSIVDEKGNALFAGFTGVSSSSDTTFTATLPKGIDGTKVEVLAATSGTTAIKRVVTKNNNGRSFTVKRVKHTSTALTGFTVASTSSITFADQTKAPFAVGDELKLFRKPAAPQTACGAHTTATDDFETRIISGVAYVSSVVTLTVPTIVQASSNCDLTFTRTTIVLDSMPDEMAAATTGLDVDLYVTGPTGSCSVAESVKGTTESSVCSNRGNCDGGSGLCACHEGYSGEACESQTVLV